jgi:hypothetical protein
MYVWSCIVFAVLCCAVLCCAVLRTTKVLRLADGLPYALRRIVGCRLSEEYARAALKPWLALHGAGRNGRDAAHPALVPIRDVFATQDFGDGGCMWRRVCVVLCLLL